MRGDGENDESFEVRVEKNARRFDLPPLLELLREHGYEREDILFESCRENATSPTLVEAVRFRPEPLRGVSIMLNIGLLADGSLLPAYFQEQIVKSHDPERFFDFIRFFDHRAIDGFTRAAYPEGEGGPYRDYERTLRSYFGMMGIASIDTLQWVFQRYFPELCVRVTRRLFANESTSHAAQTGESRLDGTGILGRSYAWDAAGFVVDLVAEEETDENGRTYASVIRKRLDERVLPLLGPFAVPLVIRLSVLHHASFAKVDELGVRAHGYLGFDRLRGDPEAGHTIVLHRGITGEAHEKGTAF